MRIINKSRGQGKSLQLLHTSELTGYQIICPNEQQAQYLKKMAEELGLIVPEPISYKKYASIKGSSLNTDKILIDNVDHILDEILTAYFKTNICAVTMSVPMKDSRINIGRDKSSANERCWLYQGCPCRTAGCYGLPDEGCPVYRWFKKLIEEDKK